MIKQTNENNNKTNKLKRTTMIKQTIKNNDKTKKERKTTIR